MPHDQRFPRVLSEWNFMNEDIIAEFEATLSKTFAENPYPIYRKLRDVGPIFSPKLNSWIISSFADVSFVLSSNHFTKGNPQAMTRPVDADPAYNMIKNWMLTQDSEIHAQLRSIFEPFFAREVIAGLTRLVMNHVTD